MRHCSVLILLVSSAIANAADHEHFKIGSGSDGSGWIQAQFSVYRDGDKTRYAITFLVEQDDFPKNCRLSLVNPAVEEIQRDVKPLINLYFNRDMVLLRTDPELKDNGRKRDQWHSVYVMFLSSKIIQALTSYGAEIRFDSGSSRFRKNVPANEWSKWITTADERRKTTDDKELHDSGQLKKVDSGNEREREQSAITRQPAAAWQPHLQRLLTNRVDVEFTAGRAGVLGQAGDSHRTKTVLVSSGSQVYALHHAQDTLLNVSAGVTGWNYLFGTLRRGFALVQLENLFFLQADPRIILAPISANQAIELGVAVYPLATEPFKLLRAGPSWLDSEAVMVEAGEGYYGEAPFQIDPAAPKHVRMRRERFSSLFDEFIPSRGDLVFSKTGEVLGIMANGEYCLMLDDLTVGGKVKIGSEIGNRQNQRIMSEMHSRVNGLPNELK